MVAWDNSQCRVLPFGLLALWRFLEKFWLWLLFPFWGKGCRFLRYKPVIQVSRQSVKKKKKKKGETKVDLLLSQQLAIPALDILLAVYRCCYNVLDKVSCGDRLYLIISSLSRGVMEVMFVTWCIGLLFSGLGCFFFAWIRPTFQLVVKFQIWLFSDL